MKKTAFLLILLAGVLWGTSGIFAHYLYPYGFSPLELVFCRAILSFLLLAVYILIRDRRLLLIRPKELPLLLLVGLGIFGTASLYYTSMAMTSVSTAVILMYTAPVYVLFLSVLFLGERLSRLKLASVGLMLLGCCFVSGIIGGLRFDALGLLAGVRHNDYHLFHFSGSDKVYHDIPYMTSLCPVGVVIGVSVKQIQYRIGLVLIDVVVLRQIDIICPLAA